MNNILSDNYIGYKIRLYPTIEQKEIFKRYFGVCRFIYNLGIKFQEDHYKEAIKDDKIKYKTLSFVSLNNKLTEYKKICPWLYDYDATSLKLILLDVIRAYKTYFNKKNNHPKYKKKKYHIQSFPVRDERLIIEDRQIYLPSIGYIFTNYHNHPECIGYGNKEKKNSIYKHYINSRVLFDGHYYWLCFSLKENIEEHIQSNSCKRFINNEIWLNKNESEPIGIDLGCKKRNWIVDSKGNRISRPDCSKENRKIGKYQHKLSIKRKINKEKINNSTVTIMSKEPSYTKNELKILKKLNKAYKRKTNKKKNAIYEYSNTLLSYKPSSVVMETLYEETMYLDKHSLLSINKRTKYNQIIKDSMLYTIRHIIETKCNANNIPFILADREYPSSQLCSKCGHRQKIGMSRVYKCKCCGQEIDRDYNAALNLSYLGYDNFYEYDYVV